MSAYAIVMTVTYLILVVGAVSIGLRAQQEKLPMNSWAGLKTPKLIANETAWIQGHKAAAGYIMLGGVPFIIGAILFFFVDESYIAFISLPIVLIMLISMIASFKKANDAAEQYKEAGDLKKSRSMMH